MWKMIKCLRLFIDIFVQIGKGLKDLISIECAPMLLIDFDSIDKMTGNGT